MTLKETQIQTRIPDINGEFTPTPVFYTDTLSAVDITDLAWSPHIGGWLDYLMVGFFREGSNTQWFFSNARRHEDLKRAIEQDLGIKADYAHGQLRFGQSKLREGDLEFSDLFLFTGGISPEEHELRQAIATIDPEFISEQVFIGEPSISGSKWKWLYEKRSGGFKRVR